MSAGGWPHGWREEAWARLSGPWDVLVIGGGITGAGVLLEAARAGLRALLVEQRDFAWGTSSRSSKLVHGGIRYLRQGHVLLTRAAARERVRLITEAPGLVDALGFLLPTRAGLRDRVLLHAALAAYDALAGRWDHPRFSREELALRAPRLRQDGISGGFRYEDARTDDARLVLRVLREAQARGALALNHVRVESLLRTAGGVEGVALRDGLADCALEVRARAVVNATGAWADRLRHGLGAAPRLRPLRGSHLTFPAWRLPAAEAVMIQHPSDKRPLFVVPWEGVTLVGTTDLDHRESLDEEPGMTSAEGAYILDALRHWFPALELRASDALASFCGVRPVIGTGQARPSREPRDHVVWDEGGLLTVTGGKLTTFRLIARDALRALGRRPGFAAAPAPAKERTLSAPPALAVAGPLGRRLAGRHGFDAPALLAASPPDELELVPGTQTCWAELRWAARMEAVAHLDDLMLRRVRLGLLLPEGGAALLPRVRALCQAELGWDGARWEREEAAYRALWRAHYAPERA
jgi:glycerol-3-phosphate dehydrogenase